VETPNACKPLYYPVLTALLHCNVLMTGVVVVVVGVVVVVVAVVVVVIVVVVLTAPTQNNISVHTAAYLKLISAFSTTVTSMT